MGVKREENPAVKWELKEFYGESDLYLSLFLYLKEVKVEIIYFKRRLYKVFSKF